MASPIRQTVVAKCALCHFCFDLAESMVSDHLGLTSNEVDVVLELRGLLPDGYEGYDDPD